MSIEDDIFSVEGIAVELNGPIRPSAEYYITPTNEETSVSDFIRIRIMKKIVNIKSVVVFDGLGRVAHGNYLLKNLRLTYELDWIRDTHKRDVV